MGLFRRPGFETPCQVRVEQSDEHFHAHVELAGDVAIGPGDRVTLDGAPIRVPFGSAAVFSRIARVEPAGPLLRLWTRLAAHLELAELYEVSFTSRRLS
jgi:hypothetical protein